MDDCSCDNSIAVIVEITIVTLMVVLIKMLTDYIG